MKFFLLLLAFSLNLYAVCDSPISRTNNSANAVLTSTKYNADLNTVYSAANLVDGSCLTDATVTADKLDTSSLAPVTYGIREGCKVTRSDAATLSVDKCILSIGGNMVKTTAANTVTWGCSGCSSEASSASFYLYAKSDSTLTTLNLLISSVAPNNDSYNAGGDKVLAKFYNNGSGDIDQYSVDQWSGFDFVAQETGWVDFTMVIDATTTAPTKATTTVIDKAQFRRNGTNMDITYTYYHSNNTGAAGGTGIYLFKIPNSSLIDDSSISTTTSPTSSVAVVGSAVAYAGSWDNVEIKAYNTTYLVLYNSSAEIGAGNMNIGNADVRYSFSVSVPISGWEK